MAGRDVARDILTYHRGRWKRQFDAEMAVNYGRDLRHIKYLLKIADEATLLSGIEEMFRMWENDLMGDRLPDVNNLRGWWNRICVRMQQSPYREFQEQG